MIFEKIFITQQSRQVKVTLRGYYSQQYTKIEHYVDVLVKEGRETSFHKLAGLNLPVYGGFETGDGMKLREQILALSGITDQQLSQVLKEFTEISRSSVLW
ncbi:hypothetical protein [Dyadobacter sp. NIV53]|uniref:hypothetical protein n=1 Tax=Dyadobacter sp. NIV53 TaxID=2861765 RepID=UPI001C88503E|nr:hypothetical protein [Dyadobacter sp. NIV53]